MKTFRLNQRVRVLRNVDGIDLDGRTGVVRRLRMRDNCAWIALHVRAWDDEEAVKAHPFPREDERGTHVLASPVDCESVDYGPPMPQSELDQLKAKHHERMTGRSE